MIRLRINDDESLKNLNDQLVLEWLSNTTTAGHWGGGGEDGLDRNIDYIDADSGGANMQNQSKSGDQDLFIVWATLVTETSDEISVGNTWNTTPLEIEEYSTDPSYNMTSMNNSGSSDVTGLDFVIHWSGFKVGVLIGTLLILFETVIGNVLVIAAIISDKKLQTPFNYYIMNLAMCDMNVGLSVMTLFVAHNLYEFFPFNTITCAYWIWSDWTMTFESVATLTAIRYNYLSHKRNPTTES